MQPTHFRIPAGQAQSETVIKNSVFIGDVARARDPDEAQAFVAQMQALYPDANHHAWAFRISGDPQGLIGSSDDGEPGGTAGRPMLAVLEGSGLWEVVAVVTRYFGGTKLGTGGLVRAYSGAVREALKLLPTQELLLHWVATLSVDYGLYGHLKYLLPRHEVQIGREDFAEQVSLEIIVPYDRAATLSALVSELTNGGINLENRWAEGRYVERMAFG
ncbi:MAG: YigZ family protein [Anaerolineae bacterium]|nr:YigZ family protein [Anaerolineae bacterium]